VYFINRTLRVISYYYSSEPPQVLGYWAQSCLWRWISSLQLITGLPPPPKSILPVGLYYRAACCDSLVFLIPSIHFTQQFWYSSISWTIFFFGVQSSSNFWASNFQCCQAEECS
jgi:hypothetical protein